MEALLRNQVIEAIGVLDADPQACRQAADLAPGTRACSSLAELLELAPDGVVIATPSALHAQQAVQALEAGAAVFCQKPLARTRAETQRVIDAAERHDRLLAVDFSYRCTAAMQALRALVANGRLGRIRALDLVFHNAYGPDKSWFMDPRLSGGGCMIDLGSHLVDLALWLMDAGEVVDVHARLQARGHLHAPAAHEVEDLGFAQLLFECGAVARIACSWHLHAGRDAVIEVQVHGTDGGAAMRNVAGSFYDFSAESYSGTSVERLTQPPDEWGPRALLAWARRLAADRSFDSAVTTTLAVAGVIDAIYGRTGDTAQHTAARRIAGGATGTAGR